MRITNNEDWYALSAGAVVFVTTVTGEAQVRVKLFGRNSSGLQEGRPSGYQSKIVLLAPSELEPGEFWTVVSGAEPANPPAPEPDAKPKTADRLLRVKIELDGRTILQADMTIDERIDLDEHGLAEAMRMQVELVLGDLEELDTNDGDDELTKALLRALAH